LALPGDFRWHAFTVMAVILAFGLGVLAGVALPYESLLLERQQSLIQRLEDEFRSLRADNQRLAQWAAQQEERDREYQTWARRLARLAAAGRLAGRTVAVLTLGQPAAGLRDEVGAVLSAAGAEVRWIGTGGSAWPQQLEAAAPQGVVVLDSGGADPLEPLLLEVRRRAGAAVPLVLATPSETRAAQAAARVPPPFTALDHAADPLGQAALVLGLLGVQGYFGYGAAAAGPLPPAGAAVPVLGGMP